MSKSILLFGVLCSFSRLVFSQGCCSGGSASPIAGGTSQGVLNDKQMESVIHAVKVTNHLNKSCCLFSKRNMLYHMLLNNKLGVH